MEQATCGPFKGVFCKKWRWKGWIEVLIILSLRISLWKMQAGLQTGNHTTIPKHSEVGWKLTVVNQLPPWFLHFLGLCLEWILPAYNLHEITGCWSGYYDYEHCCLANRSSQSDWAFTCQYDLKILEHEREALKLFKKHGYGMIWHWSVFGVVFTSFCIWVCWHFQGSSWPCACQLSVSSDIERVNIL